ncbi:hypothetical protein FB45DRAFT_46902 [Roridomyces roridus]|uniref:Secreted protein n=1 Tax=Roridomyces roridus TaxID=1738132 RepID=A0AAD7BS45_9AGAR|nr:hypothetical protein FB45DRAFT_46902 [Roridomyces roridus]
MFISHLWAPTLFFVSSIRTDSGLDFWPCPCPSTRSPASPSSTSPQRARRVHSSRYSHPLRETENHPAQRVGQEPPVGLPVFSV